MTLRLILMRHAKSSWDDPFMRDHDRPLNGRGRISARAVGAWLHGLGIEPDQALISSSQRTRETCELLGLSKQSTNIEIREDLYHAGAQRILDAMRQASGQTVLLLAHNPGIGEFAQRIVQKSPDHPRFFDYPTCATLVAQFDQSRWADIGFGQGQALNFVIPRELQDPAAPQA